MAEVRRRPARPIEHRGPRIGMVRGTVPVKSQTRLRSVHRAPVIQLFSRSKRSRTCRHASAIFSRSWVNTARRLLPAIGVVFA